MSEKIWIVSDRTFVATEKGARPDVKPGNPFQIDKQEGEGLIARNLARPSSSPSSINVEPDPARSTKPTGDKLIAAIAIAIGDLDPEEDYTKGGDPNVRSLEKILGYDISAEDRNAAFALYQDQPPLKLGDEE